MFYLAWFIVVTSCLHIIAAATVNKPIVPSAERKVGWIARHLIILGFAIGYIDGWH